MCGYVVYPKRPTKEDLSRHLHLQRHRGTHGYGAIHLPTGVVVRHMDKDEFCKRVAERLPAEGTIIVHHRKASVGGVKKELVHPMETQHKGRYLSVFQNGTKKELCDVINADSDTQAITRFWPLFLADKEAFADLLDGAGLVFMYEQGETKTSRKRLWMHHDGFRTLHLCIEGDMKGIYASEPLMPGTWQEVDAFEGIANMPLRLPEWKDILPFSKPEEYEDNPAYSDKITYGSRSRALEDDYGYGGYYANHEGYRSKKSRRTGQTTQKPVRKTSSSTVHVIKGSANPKSSSGEATGPMMPLPRVVGEDSSGHAPRSLPEYKDWLVDLERKRNEKIISKQRKDARAAKRALH